jgi:hypothetical protein
VIFIVSAVESLSDRVLAALDKGHTRADVYEAVRLTRRAGPPLRPTFVPFTPWSTWDDYGDLLGWVDGEGLVHHVDSVQYSIRLLVPPESLLLCEGHPFGPLDPASFSHTWTHPDPRMDTLHADVARIAQVAAERGDGETATFARVCERAGRPAPARAPATRPPRLTEPWFC